MMTDTKIDFKGVSTFFYFAIPLVLGMAAVWWLAFGQGLHYFRRALQQEKRHAEIVGAFPLPKAPLKIELHNRRDSPIQIVRAEIDGDDLWIYYKNVSSEKSRFIRFVWKLIAPDGTVVRELQGYPSVYGENQSPDELEAGEQAELRLKIESDPRAVILSLSMGR